MSFVGNVGSTDDPCRSSSETMSALWITWNVHRRTTGLCEAWNIPLHVVPHRRKGLTKSVEQAVGTIRRLREGRPDILFVQNPSLALTILATLVRPFFGYGLVVDAHNEGVRPFARPGRVVRWVTRRLLKAADANIVSNAALAEDVSAAGGRALVLPDRLPEPALPQSFAVTESPRLVVVISSFHVDEPVDAVIAAAGILPDVRFVFTGDVRRFARRDEKLPANVELAGYLAESAFWKLLSRAAVVCDLTLKPDCLVCGAYEALALAKPMVLSANPPTREIFGAAAVLTDEKPASIVKAIRQALEDRRALGQKARELRESYGEPWRKQASATWDAVCKEATAGRRKLA